MPCLHPVYLKNGAIVPCGKCYNCQSRKRNDWVFRMMQELKFNTNAYFVTLTYSPDKVDNKKFDRTHLYRYDCKNFETLNKSHVSEFLKRLQMFVKKITGDKTSLVRYYLTGEYGDLHNHPHYHAVMFFPPAVCDGRLQVNQILSEVWSFGFVDVKPVSQATMNYLAKHQMKECRGNQYQEKFAPIFSKMTRYNGGIGCHYLDDPSVCAYHSSDKSALVFCNGVKMPLPAYYRKKLYPTMTEEEQSRFVALSFIEHVQDFESFFGKGSFCRFDASQRYQMLSSLNSEKLRSYYRKKYTKTYIKQKLNKSDQQ